MFDMYTARQAYRTHEINNIGSLIGSHNLADGLTKPKFQAALYQLLVTAYHKPKAEQWIIRDPSDILQILISREKA